MGEKFEDGASRINKSDMYYGDDWSIADGDLDHLDELTRKHTVSLRMAPGDAVLVDNYQTMHGRNVFKGTRKHAVSWFKEGATGNSILVTLIVFPEHLLGPQAFNSSLRLFCDTFGELLTEFYSKSYLRRFLSPKVMKS